MTDDVRTFANTCAKCIASMQAIDADTPSMVVVVIANQRGTVLEMDASTVIVGPRHSDPPELLREFARRVRPAIEAVTIGLAREYGAKCTHRSDLEAQCADGPDISELLAGGEDAS